MEIAATTSSTSTRVAGQQPGQLGKQDFLRLLIAQLQNQNPLKPMDDTQLIAQMAQFSALEAMQSLDERIAQLAMMEEVGQASSLIGKVVQARAKDGGTVEGVVDLVKMVDGSPLLRVGDSSVKLSDVTSIAEEKK